VKTGQKTGDPVRLAALTTILCSRAKHLPLSLHISSLLIPFSLILTFSQFGFLTSFLETVLLGHAKPNNVPRAKGPAKGRLGVPSLNAVIEDRDSSSNVQSMNQGMYPIVIARLWKVMCFAD
jgi:hypothetical protein